MAMIGVSFSSKARTIPRVPYFFQKPDPQCETTWASSTTTESMWLRISGFRKTFLTKRLESIISGEITTICHLPLQTSYLFIRCVQVSFSYRHDFFGTASVGTIYCRGSKSEFLLKALRLGKAVSNTAKSFLPAP